MPDVSVSKCHQKKIKDLREKTLVKKRKSHIGTLVETHKTATYMYIYLWIKLIDSTYPKKFSFLT